MRLARFVTADGSILSGQMVDEHSALPLVGDLFGQHRFDTAPLPVRRLLAPVAPPNIFCIGRNYREHARETGSPVPERPLVFQKPTSSLCGPDALIRLPRDAPQQVDFEAELALVIGRTARRVAVGEALDHVLGYTCANDVTARDCQRADGQWTRAKGFDTFCPLGPWIVTADELDPGALTIVSRLNGRVMQQASTRDMLHSCAELVSYLSQPFTLLPGTVILTGTPAGIGAARQPPVYLRPGDRIEVEIERIGCLRNIVAGPE